jgi:transcriptional regulator GlxA family with amidase domain
MEAASTIHVGGVLFEGFEFLDFYGPLEMFGLLEDCATITVAAEKTGAVRSSAGPVRNGGSNDGGFWRIRCLAHSGRDWDSESNGQPAISRRIEATGGDIADCCDRLHGSFLLARTGLLDARKATSNKRAFREVKTYAPKVEWIAKARWVELVNTSRRRVSAPEWTWPWP